MQKIWKLIQVGWLPFVMLSSILLFFIFSRNIIDFNDLQTSDYFGLIAALSAVLGFVRVINESQKSRQLKEAEFLTQLNRDFITNPIICQLYEKLEIDFRSKSKTSCIKEDEILSFVVYFTFFETVYDFIRKKIIRIQNIDDLFGYRFFIMTNNPFVLKHELAFKDLKSSYENIFRLYELWVNHRIRKYRKTGGVIKHDIVMWNYNMYDHHFDDVKQFFQFNKQDHGIVLARPSDLWTIYEIQKRSHQQLVNQNHPDYFQKSSIFELYRLIRQRTLYVKKGFWGIEAYIGYIPVSSNHVLMQHLNKDQHGMLIDTVVVDPRFRGLGYQRLLIGHLLNHAMESYDYACATIDPNNSYSVKNFVKGHGFEVYKQDLLMYGGKQRIIVIKSKQSEDIL